MLTGAPRGRPYYREKGTMHDGKYLLLNAATRQKCAIS